MDKFLEDLRAGCLLDGGYHLIGNAARAMFRVSRYSVESFALMIKLMLKLADVTEMLLTLCQRLAATP